MKGSGPNAHVDVVCPVAGEKGREGRVSREADFSQTDSTACFLGGGQGSDRGRSCM